MADPALYNAILEENKCIQNTIQLTQLEAVLSALAKKPWETSNWSAIPLLESPVGSLCVYDSTADLRCGSTCTWTVPSGATRAQFQIWGAGAGTGNGACCGGSPFGANGAYATTIIDVVEGCDYTLCAGCAYCCYACCTANNTTAGCQSYVTGYGLTGVCADGATSRISCGMKYLHGGGYTQCRYRGEGSDTASGPCLCSGGSNYCFSNSCATCGVVPFVADQAQIFYGTAQGSRVYGLPSVYSSGCFDTNHNGYFISPPVISPAHTEQLNSSCCVTFSSGTCCGGCRCRAADGFRAFPGAGGTYTHMMGGSTAWSGDAGRGGMVKVAWC